jgi:hypothetical protein
MNLKRLSIHKLFVAAALAVGSLAAHAIAVPSSTYVFSENFEGTLASWFDRNPASPDAKITTDPLNSANHVLAFNTIMGSGSVFTNTLVASSGSYTLSFDYLGMPGRGGNAGDLGGYIGVSLGGNGSNQYWAGGTGSYPTPLSLIDDGAWHHYTLTFNSPIGQAVRVMVEDWDGSYGVAGDAYFDNIVLRDTSVAVNVEVPEPGSLALVGLALAAAGYTARKRKG